MDARIFCKYESHISGGWLIYLTNTNRTIKYLRICFHDLFVTWSRSFHISGVSEWSVYFTSLLLTISVLWHVTHISKKIYSKILLNIINCLCFSIIPYTYNWDLVILLQFQCSFISLSSYLLVLQFSFGPTHLFQPACSLEQCLENCLAHLPIK